MNCLNETYASITVSDIHPRFSIAIFHACRVGEAYQIFAISETSSTLFSVLTMPLISLMGNTLIINIEVFVICLITRNRFDSALIVTGYGDQILRLNITSTTVQPCGINTHSQLVFSFFLAPDT